MSRDIGWQFARSSDSNYGPSILRRLSRLVVDIRPEHWSKRI